MKNTLKLTIAALALGLALPAARAQDEGTPPPPPPPGDNGGQPGKMQKGQRVDRLKMLVEKLGLTADQQAKIKSILKDEREAMKALRDDKALEKDAKRAKMEEIRKTHREQIKALLTPEQLKKFAELKEERGPGGPGGPGGPKE